MISWGVHPGVFAAIAVVLIGGVAFGYLGIIKPTREKALAKQIEAQKLAEQKAEEKRRLEEQMAARLEEERQAAEEARQAAEEAKRKAALAEKAAAENKVRVKRVIVRKKSRSSGSSDKDSDDPLLGLEGL